MPADIHLFLLSPRKGAFLKGGGLLKRKNRFKTRITLHSTDTCSILGLRKEKRTITKIQLRDTGLDNVEPLDLQANITEPPYSAYTTIISSPQRSSVLSFAFFMFRKC